ncbi:MAG: DUF6371 domain-containing protein [Bacteroidales bacterium]|nr:DUF6371 domain-containing protein [Bacteroidales bacterium]MDD4624672.1 DUF6371 domain-containing protein [Bacilli bacterium]
MSIELEKYKGQSTRYTCPKCGRKHSFTRYIDTETNIYIDEKVGICNRAIKCGYHYSPKQFFESMGVHKLARISTNELNQKEISGNSCKYVDRKKELIPIKQIDKKYLMQTISKPSHFLTFLFDNFPKEDVERVIKDYFIGGAMDNGVVFWQIDSNLRIRTGKIMQYNPTTGRRVKSGVSWVHSEMKKQNILPNDWQLTQCLFGEHLLIKYPEKPIMLVESEKTSIIMSLYEPSFNWMATGGLNNLTENKIYPIRKQQITAFPDLKCFELWQSKAERINKAIGSKIELSHILEEIATKEDKELGLDLADFFLREND